MWEVEHPSAGCGRQFAVATVPLARGQRLLPPVLSRRAAVLKIYATMTSRNKPPTCDPPKGRT